MTPTVPTIPGSAADGIALMLPIRLELSPLALAVVLVLAAIVFGVMSVIFVYHWRRFPYEQEVFGRVEKLYFVVSLALLAAGLAGILMS